jgi:hypothetical protein
MAEAEASWILLFLSRIKYATFLLIPLFSTLNVAANYLPVTKLGTFLMDIHNGNIYPDECLPNTYLSFAVIISDGF